MLAFRFWRVVWNFDDPAGADDPHGILWTQHQFLQRAGPAVIQQGSQGNMGYRKTKRWPLLCLRVALTDRNSAGKDLYVKPLKCHCIARKPVSTVASNASVDSNMKLKSSLGTGKIITFMEWKKWLGNNLVPCWGDRRIPLHWDVMQSPRLFTSRSIEAMCISWKQRELSFVLNRHRNTLAESARQQCPCKSHRKGTSQSRFKIMKHKLHRASWRPRSPKLVNGKHKRMYIIISPWASLKLQPSSHCQTGMESRHRFSRVVPLLSFTMKVDRQFFVMSPKSTTFLEEFVV